MKSNNDIFEALYRDTKGLVVALGYRDLMTRVHSERVRSLSEMIGAHYGLDEHDIRILGVGSVFHDIGKIGVPDDILLKPSKFDEKEWEVMKQHPSIGEDIMLSTGFDGARQAALVIRHHHERYDGSGYPDGLSGESIPICSRIIAIADSYDALSEVRPYHRARSHEEVIGILRSESGKMFDPNLIDTFCGIIEHSPNRVA